LDCQASFYWQKSFSQGVQFATNTFGMQWEFHHSKKSSLSLFGLLESQGFANPTNWLMGTYALMFATKTMHICICPNQCGCNKMNQTLVPPVGPELLHCVLWFETNPQT
jgi:hypothetical protein